jgi:hypothetical protein
MASRFETMAACQSPVILGTLPQPLTRFGVCETKIAFLHHSAIRCKLSTQSLSVAMTDLL